MFNLFSKLSGLAWIQLALAAIAVAMILLNISLDVVLRVLFNAPLDSTIEIVSYYYMIPIAFLPIMTLELKNQHVATDLFYRNFSNRLKRVSVLVAGLLTVLLYGALTYFTFEQAVNSTMRGEVSMGSNYLPIWPVRWVLPFVFLTSGIAAVAQVIQQLGTEKAPNHG